MFISALSLLLSLPVLLLLALPRAGAGLIGVTNDNRLWDLNTATGTASNPRPVTGLTGGEEVSGLTYGAGTLFGYTTANRLYAIDPTTGLAGLIGTGTIGSSDIAYDPLTGRIFGLTGGTVATMFSMDGSNASTTTIGSHNSPFNEPPGAGGGLVGENRAGLAFDSSGALWGTTRTVSLNVDSVTELRQYDPLTGQIIQRVDYSSFYDADRNDIAFDPQTGTLYFADGPARSIGSLFTLSTSTDSPTEVGLTGVSNTNQIGFGGLAFISEVPEPGSVLMLGSGLLFLARRVRKT